MGKEMDYNFCECECTCDYCGEEEIIDSVDYTEINETLKDLGWINRKIDGEWKLFCCQDCYLKYIKFKK